MPGNDPVVTGIAILLGIAFGPAVLVGLLDRFEIWNPKRFAEVRGEDQVMAGAAFTLME